MEDCSSGCSCFSGTHVTVYHVLQVWYGNEGFRLGPDEQVPPSTKGQLHLVVLYDVAFGYELPMELENSIFAADVSSMYLGGHIIGEHFHDPALMLWGHGPSFCKHFLGYNAWYHQYYEGDKNRLWILHLPAFPWSEIYQSILQSLLLCFGLKFNKSALCSFNWGNLAHIQVRISARRSWSFFEMYNQALTSGMLMLKYVTEVEFNPG